MASQRSKQVADGSRLNLGAELAGAFGDGRLSKRAAKVATAWVQGGAASFPDMLGEAGAEGLYRLVNNERFGFGEAIAAHSKQTVARARAVPGLVVVGHDTTGVEVPLHDPGDVREHFGVKSSRTQGFELHVSAAFSFDRHNTPLGVLDCRPFVHGKHLGDDARGKAAWQYWWELGGLYPNEQMRWLESIAFCHDELGDKAADAVHVCDREADDFATLAWAVHNDVRIVQRAHTARRFVGPKRIPIADALAGSQKLAQVTVALGSRTPNRSAKDKKVHPPRKARMAQLTVRAGVVRVMAPKNADGDGTTIHGTDAPLPAWLDLTLVDVREEHPPAGEEPVRWLLLTTEPAATAAAALTVVDLYRCRWGIEVLFKVLKTGLGLEKRQAESADAMLGVVSLALPVATEVLRLRHMAEVAPGALWSTVLTATQFEVLRRKSPRAKLTSKATVDQVVRAVAALGGFLKSNKTPGWQTIYKGWAYLEALAEGFQMAKGRRSDR